MILINNGRSNQEVTKGAKATVGKRPRKGAVAPGLGDEGQDKVLVAPVLGAERNPRRR